MHSSDPHILDTNSAPTPFSAAQIRTGCPVGRTIELRVETPGSDPVTRVIRFTSCDEHGATQEAQNLALDGSPLGPPVRSTTTWLDLQAHASFPLEETVVERTIVETPLGSLAASRYTITRGDEVETFWFADDHPGMPVQFSKHVAGEIVSRTTVTKDSIASDASP